MATQPIPVVCPADEWTKVATDVTAGSINRMSKKPNLYLQTWRATGEAAPTDDSEGIPIFQIVGDNKIEAVAAIDVYIWPRGAAGKVRRDVP